MLRFQSEIFCSLLANALKDHSTMRNTFTKRTFRSDCEGRCASSAHFQRFTSIVFSLETQKHLPPCKLEREKLNHHTASSSIYCTSRFSLSSVLRISPKFILHLLQ